MVGLDSAGKTTILYRLQVGTIMFDYVRARTDVFLDRRGRVYYSKYVSIIPTRSQLRSVYGRSDPRTMRRCR
jgi:GTPase SAR1 family protein